MTDIPTTQPPPPPLVNEQQTPRPAWPAVIGTLSIVVFAIGCLGRIRISFSASDWREILQNPLHICGVLLLVLGWIILIVLLMAGIRLIRRWKSARTMHLHWAVYEIIYTFIKYTFAMIFFGRRFFSYDLEFWFQALAVAMLAITILLELTWPVFILIWFNRAKIKQQIAEW